MKHTVHFEDVPANCYAALILLHKAYKQMERKKWNKSRDAFLDIELGKHGVLTCHYCNRSGLNRSGGKQRDKATIDHIVSRSVGGEECNHANFVVSCDGCNRKKSDLTKEEFMTSKYLLNKRK